MCPRHAAALATCIGIWLGWAKDCLSALPQSGVSLPIARGERGQPGNFYSICSSLIIDEVYQARFTRTFSSVECALGHMHLLYHWMLLKVPPGHSFCVIILLFLSTTVDWKWGPFCCFSQEFWSLCLWHLTPLSPQTKATASELRVSQITLEIHSLSFSFQHRSSPGGLEPRCITHSHFGPV